MSHYHNEHAKVASLQFFSQVFNKSRFHLNANPVTEAACSKLLTFHACFINNITYRQQFLANSVILREKTTVARNETFQLARLCL